MRRLISISFAFAAVVAISACDSPRETASASASASASAASQPERVASADFASLDNLKGFPVGKGPSVMALPTAYVLFDTQCPHCAHLWEAAKPLQSKVLIKWIPVGLLNGLSTTQGAMLLEATDPVTLMTSNEAVFTRTGRPSTATESVTEESRKSVEKNTEMLNILKATSVPTIVYRNPVTQELAIKSGSMPTENLAELLGVSPVPASAPTAIK
jgi:thiol:disulfide interchange protein DsbG